MAEYGQRSLRFAIRGPLACSDLPGLYQRVCRLLTISGAALLECDVDGVRADAVAVDALARFALAARRRGCVVKLRGASVELLELVAFIGLDDVLTSSTRPTARTLRRRGLPRP